MNGTEQAPAPPKPAASEAEPRVFISYRRQDSSDQAHRLHDELVRRFGDDEVFIDVAAIGPGELWRERIARVLEACWAVLVVIGPQWLTAKDDTGKPRIWHPQDVLRTEIEAALRRSDVEVIPVLVGGAQMPRSDELPESLRPLGDHNAAEITEMRWRYDFRVLAAALEKRLLPTGGRRQRIESLMRFLVYGIIAAIVVGMAVRWLVGEPNAVRGDVLKGVVRQTEIWALVGVTLAAWLAISRGELGRVATLALAGLILGAIGGALGGAILNVPKHLAQPEVLDRDVVDAIWIGSRAAHGLMIGALLGVIWVPRAIATGMAAGLFGGALCQVLYIGLDWDWRQSNFDGIASTGIECAAIVGLATLALLARSWGAASGPRRTAALAGPGEP